MGQFLDRHEELPELDFPIHEFHIRYCQHPMARCFPNAYAAAMSAHRRALNIAANRVVPT